MIRLASTRVWTAIAIVVTALATARAQDLQGWRTPDGKLYFGGEPPPGSTRIESARSKPARAATPTERVLEPSPSITAPHRTATPRPAATAEPVPTPRPAVSPKPARAATPTERVPEPSPSIAAPQRAATPRPVATAERAPTPRPAVSPAMQGRRPDTESERSHPGATVVWQREPACGDVVAIRDARPTINFEANRLTMIGKVLVGKSGPVKDVRVCLGGSCVLVADGDVLRDGDVARFTLTVARQRPEGLTVECFVPRRR